MVDFILNGLKQWVRMGYCRVLSKKGSRHIWRWPNGIWISRYWISLLSCFIDERGKRGGALGLSEKNKIKSGFWFVHFMGTHGKRHWTTHLLPRRSWLLGISGFHHAKKCLHEHAHACINEHLCICAKIPTLGYSEWTLVRNQTSTIFSLSCSYTHTCTLKLASGTNQIATVHS